MSAPGRARVPPLDDVRPLPPDVVEGFRARGHAVVRGLATAEEVAAYRPSIESAAASRSLEVRPLDERDTYGRAFLQSAGLWRHDEVVRRFVFARRFAAAAAALLGVEGVRLYHDQALVKEAHGGHTPWHQDQFYWPLDGDQTVTMWMPLADLRPEVGSMTFASGTHRRGALCDLAISDESEAALQAWVDRTGVELETYGALRAGDATFHAGWTLHRAAANPTGAPRPVMTVIYVADGAVVTSPANPYQEFDRQVWLDGCEPGRRVGGASNPRLFGPEVG